MTHEQGGCNDESHYTVWTAWISVGVRADFILQNLTPLCTVCGRSPQDYKRGPTEGPTRLQRGPTEGPTRLQRGPTEGPTRLQRGPTEGPTRLQTGPTEGPTRLQRGPTEGPTILRTRRGDSGKQGQASVLRICMKRPALNIHSGTSICRTPTCL